MHRIILGSVFVIITMVVFPSVEKVFVYLPMIFALSVSLFNSDKIKVNHLLSIFLTLVQSYIVFLGLALVMYFFEELLIDIYSIEITEYGGIIMITTGGYLAALLLFYFNSFIFKVANMRFSFIVISACYALVVLAMFVFSKNEYLQFGLDKFSSFLVSWCIFMSLAYSISLNRETFLGFTTLKKA